MSNLWAAHEKSIGHICRYLTAVQFEYAANLSTRYSYLYVETPKVACSTIKLTLQRLELDDPSFNRLDFEDIHDRAFSPLLKPSQIGDFTKYIQRKDVFKFCFCRNPYTRLLSAYLDKIKGNRPQKKEILRHLGKDSSQLASEITFDTFVNVICEQPISQMDPHWRVQFMQTCQEDIQYDFIGSVENFDDDYEQVLARLTPDHEPYLTTEIRHATNSVNKLHQYYTATIRKMVLDKFRRDFDYFGYDPDWKNADQPPNR